MPIALKSPRIVLRPWQEEDAPVLFSLASDPAVGPIAGWPPHMSVADSLRVIRDILSAPETYAAVLSETGEPAGSIGLHFGDAGTVPLSEGEAELGYWIGRKFWGRGLAPEAADMLIRHGFVDLRLSTLWCGYCDGNDRSRRVQEKCGFVFHHTEKDVTCEPMGDVRTAHISCLTKRMWENQKR